MSDQQKINEAWAARVCQHDWQGAAASSDKVLAWRCQLCGEVRGIQPLTNMGGTHKVNFPPSA
jgi:hypothetical protein